MKGLLLSLFFGVTSLSAMLFAQESGIKKNVKVVILLGPPGSGKGTQAVRLTKELDIPHISTGDLFRENISKDTELGRRAKSYINAGKLVPDEVVLDMLFDRILKPDAQNGYLLDGFPRTVPQAEAFDKNLKSNINLSVIDLEVPDEIIFKRATGRLTCQSCGNIHNRYFSPPIKEGCCNQCGGELVQRSDDKAEVVQERLRVYHEQTQPLVDYYSRKGLLRRVDGTKSPNEVYESIKSALEGV
jgi:adenylate kinase